MKKVVIGVAALILGGLVLLWLGARNQATAPEISPESQTNVAPTGVMNGPDAEVAQAVKAALVQKHQWDPETFEVEITQGDSTYVRGTVMDVGSPTGGMVYAAQVNGTWEVVWDGNGAILCSDLADYPNYPEELIPECYDQDSGEILKR